MKEVFDCLVDSDQDYEAYEELEDDFVLLVNDGKPALELVEDENPDNLKDFANKGVLIIEEPKE